MQTTCIEFDISPVDRLVSHIIMNVNRPRFADSIVVTLVITRNQSI